VAEPLEYRCCRFFWVGGLILGAYGPTVVLVEPIIREDHAEIHQLACKGITLRSGLFSAAIIRPLSARLTAEKIKLDSINVLLCELQVGIFDFNADWMILFQYSRLPKRGPATPSEFLLTWMGNYGQGAILRRC
jgi:hypothetical protein